MASNQRKTRRHGTRRQRYPKFVIVLGVLAVLLFGGAGVALGIGSMWLSDMPDYQDASAYNYGEKTKVYANDGKTLLAEFYIENREPVGLDEISNYVKEGTVATEDERYYEHGGVDPIGIARAIFVNLTGGHEGASTITQQFVRNTILADEAQEATLKRKLREAYISIQLEGMYSKDEVLNMYLNTINYGSGAYGIEAASKRYFSKSAKDLTLAESAALVAIPYGPSLYNPIDNPKNCTSRRNLVLDRMLSNGYITQEEHDAAQAEELKLKVSENPDNGDGIYKYKYFTSYVRDTLLQEYSVAEVFKGGLTVVTTIDPDVQEQAEKACSNKRQYLNSKLDIALVAVDPDTGFIKALVGGKDYDTDQYNLATQAKRQPGSSFKTFTLLAALNEGISPTTNLNCHSPQKFGNWNVRNFGGHDYGIRTIASAFAVSSNTGFAQLCTHIGPEKVVEMAKKCGVTSELEAVPSITLGSEEVSVREMAQAYATIANGGTYREAVPIQEIRDSTGKVIYSANTTGVKVLDTKLTDAAIDVMKGVVQSGTGRDAQLYTSQPVAGKTGTSEQTRDKWFVGITPQYSVAIWIGGRTEVSMSSSVSCDDVFGYFMRRLLKGASVEQFPEAQGKLDFKTFDIGYGTNSSNTGTAKHEGESATTTSTGDEKKTEQKPEDQTDQATQEPIDDGQNSSSTTTTKPSGGSSSASSGGSSGGSSSSTTGGGSSGGSSGTSGGSSGGDSGSSSGGDSGSGSGSGSGDSGSGSGDSGSGSGSGDSGSGSGEGDGGGSSGSSSGGGGE